MLCVCSTYYPTYIFSEPADRLCHSIQPESVWTNHNKREIYSQARGISNCPKCPSSTLVHGAGGRSMMARISSLSNPSICRSVNLAQHPAARLIHIDIHVSKIPHGRAWLPVMAMKVQRVSLTLSLVQVCIEQGNGEKTNDLLGIILSKRYTLYKRAPSKSVTLQ